MNCPKCGYPQEERLDCVKCGIVFSKYVLHLTDRASRPESQAAQQRSPLQPALPDELPPTDLAELRQTVRELSRRFGEVEFERAERNQIRSELRGLDQKMRDAVSQMGARLADFESRVDDIPQTPPDPPLDLLKEQIWEEDLRPLLEKIDRLEAALEKTAQDQSALPDPQVADALARLESRLGELDGKIAAAQGAEAKGAGALESALRELGELRPAVQAATIRYSEIGDLKKNALVLQNQVESLQHAIESVRKDPFNGGSAKLNELQTEVLALRAEVRQSFKQLAALDAPTAAHGADLRALADDVAALKKWVGEYTPVLVELKNGMASLESESAEMAARLAALEQRLQGLETPSEDSRPPIEDDVHSIRDNLDQIRAFMNTLARKL